MIAAVVWVMVGIALWHFAVLVPDRFRGGIIGAFLAAVIGAFVSGYLLPVPGWQSANPPGLSEALWPIPGSVVALVACWWWGKRIEERSSGAQHAADEPTPA